LRLVLGQCHHSNDLTGQVLSSLEVKSQMVRRHRFRSPIRSSRWVSISSQQCTDSPEYAFPLHLHVMRNHFCYTQTPKSWETSSDFITAQLGPISRAQSRASLPLFNLDVISLGNGDPSKSYKRSPCKQMCCSANITAQWKYWLDFRRVSSH
jgi:hypothetical protein